MDAKEIKAVLLAHLPDCDVEVGGDGNHFDITVVGDVFAGLNAVKKQQLVYAGINEYIAAGTIHAVNMKTFTREEWSAAQ